MRTNAKKYSSETVKVLLENNRWNFWSKDWEKSIIVEWTNGTTLKNFREDILKEVGPDFHYELFLGDEPTQFFTTKTGLKKIEVCTKTIPLNSPVRYLRLLTYDNACKVIEFINKNDKADFAHVTPGGVSMQVSNKNWEKVEAFIKSLNVRFEIGLEAPWKVEEHIVSSLREEGVIAHKSSLYIKSHSADKTNKNLTAPEKRFLQLISDLNIKTDRNKYPQVLFFFKGNSLLMDYMEQVSTMCISEKNVWSVLKTEFKLTDPKIEKLTLTVLQNHFTLNITRTFSSKNGDKSFPDSEGTHDNVEKHFNQKVDTFLNKTKNGR